MKSKITIILSIIIVIVLMVVAFVCGRISRTDKVITDSNQTENQSSGNNSGVNSVNLEFTDEEAANALSRLLDIYGSANGNPLSALTSRGLRINVIADGGYLTTDHPFSTFLTNMSRLCTENFVRTNEKFSFWYKEDANGNLSINGGSGTGCQYIVNSVTKVDGNSYTADVSLIPPSLVKLPYTVSFTVAGNKLNECVIDSIVITENKVEPTTNFTDEQVSKSLTGLLNFYGQANGNPLSVLTSNGIRINILTEGGYLTTDYPFSTFLSNMSRLCTENFVRTNEKFSLWYKEDGNGNLSINGGSGTGCLYEVNSVTRVYGDTYTAAVTLIAPSGARLPHTAIITVAQNQYNECVIDSMELTAN